VWKIAPALAWGNAVVWKPAEDSPTSATLLARLALEAGLPAGVLNVVQGLGSEVGAALLEAGGIDRVAFTGSTATGRVIGRSAGERLIPVSLELGGKGATIVFADADLELAAATAARAVFNNSGQVCLAGTRLIVTSGCLWADRWRDAGAVPCYVPSASVSDATSSSGTSTGA